MMGALKINNAYSEERTDYFWQKKYCSGEDRKE